MFIILFSISEKKMFGIFLALVAVVWYSKLNLDAQNAPPTSKAHVEVERPIEKV